jgi:hypothetical protein
MGRVLDRWPRAGADSKRGKVKCSLKDVYRFALRVAAEQAAS